jgi:hypothetical protein
MGWPWPHKSETLWSSTSCTCIGVAPGYKKLNSFKNSRQTRRAQLALPKAPCALDQLPHGFERSI